MPLKTGICGYGRSGCNIHARWLRQVPDDFTIVAVADQLAERRDEAAADFGCATYADYRELLDAHRGGLDLVVIALPSDLHVRAADAALAAGYAVVCEKPLGRSVAEFDRLVATAEAAGRPLLPFQNSRFSPVFRKIQDIIASGVLGELLHVRLNWSGFARRWDWQTLQARYGGNLLNTGPHPVDQAVVLLDGAMPEVCCQMRSIQTFGGDAEDYCNVTLWAPQRPTVEVVLSSYMAYPCGEFYHIQGTLGGLTATLERIRWKHFDPAAAPVQELRTGWSDQRRYCGEELPWREHEWTVPDEEGDLFRATCRGFYRDAHAVLTTGAERTIRLDEVRRQIAIIEACHRQNPLPRRVELETVEA